MVRSCIYELHHELTVTKYLYIIHTILTCRFEVFECMFIAAGLDYLPVSTTLEFPAGSTKGTKQCISVSIIDDLLSEGEETFNIHAEVNSSSDSRFGGALDSSHGTIEVSILDNDGKPALHRIM